MTARFAIGLLVAALIALAVPGVASAAILNVTTTVDDDDKSCTPADCTLREAVQQGGSNDTINVPAGNYVLTMSNELVLSGDKIVGVGARTTFIDGGDKTRVLRVVAGERASEVSGVTIRNGNGNSSTSPGFGGGILQNASLALTDVTVAGNAASYGGGIAVAAGTLQLIGSTISGNLASTGRLSSGGGMLVETGATAQVANTTFSGNIARDNATQGDFSSQGGGIFTAGTLVSLFVTIAGNTARGGGGLWQEGAGASGPGARTTMNHTILAGNAGGACAGPGIGAQGVITSHHDVVDDESCMLTGASEQQGVNPLIGPLQNNGGPTDTRALAVNSPAINAAGSCLTNDQRGVARPGGSTCDIGAFEFIPPTLRVTTTVVNDNGGTKAASDFVVHVRQGGVDVPKSPQNGNANGTTFVLTPGTFNALTEGVSGYSVTISGDCNSKGDVALAENQAKACTITVNDVQPTLTVITGVTNDNGGTKVPADFTAHVRSGATDVATSPQNGSGTGTVYTLNAGSYTVSGDALPGYTMSVSAGCAPIVLAVGSPRTCTITADDVASAAPPPPPPPPSPPQASAQQLPAPVIGKAVNAVPKTGTVRIKLPGTSVFVVLEEGKQIPVGTIVDALKGRVTIVAAADKNGGTATADFYGGIFKLGQTGGASPITTLKLVEKLSCKKSGKASASAKKKTKRRLWGDGKGRFRTEGSYSSATVRGTKWLVQDSCTSTLTKVTRGKVDVRDFAKRKTVLVKAGKQYVARRKN